jgi:hypothetical protein
MATTAAIRRGYMRARTVTMPMLVLTAIFWAGAAPSTVCLTRECIDGEVLHAQTVLKRAETATLDPTARISALDDARSSLARLRTIAASSSDGAALGNTIIGVEARILRVSKQLHGVRSATSAQRSSDLASEFRLELAQTRPDFGRLKKIEHAARSADKRTADWMGDSILQRVAGVSGTLVKRIDASLNGELIDSAQIDIAYAKAQLPHLWVSTVMYARFEARLSEVASLGSEIAFVAGMIARANSLTATMRLRDAHEAIAMADARLSALKPTMRAALWDTYHFRNRRCQAALVHREDSLVARAVALLRSSGIVTAMDYCERALKPLGLSATGLTSIDESAGLTTSGSGDDASTSHSGRVRQNNQRVLAANMQGRIAARTDWRRGKAERIAVNVFRLLDAGETAEAQKLLQQNRRVLARGLTGKDVALLRAAVAP